jgi:hypothetical protein
MMFVIMMMMEIMIVVMIEVTAALRFDPQELSEARALLLRLRRRDLFALVGEVLLSNQDYEGLLSSRHDGVMTSMIIRKEVYESVRSIQYPDEEDRTAVPAAAGCCPISENDLFCEIIKMNYGKGILNPVDGPTAFYRPKKRLDGDDDDDMDDDREGDVCEGGTFESMGEQDRYWSVGVMPQGSLPCLSISWRLYSVYGNLSDHLNNPHSSSR